MTTLRVPAGIDKSWEQKRKDIKSFFSIFGKSDIKHHPKSSSQDVSVLSRIETTYMENTTDLEKLELKSKHKRRSISHTRMPSFNRHENICSTNRDDVKLKSILEHQLRECVHELNLTKQYISTLTEENLRLNLYVESLEQKPLRAMTNLENELKRLRSQHTSLEEDNKLLVYEVLKLESIMSECSYCSSSMSHGKQIKLGSEIDDSMVSKVIEELNKRQTNCNKLINEVKLNSLEQSDDLNVRNSAPLHIKHLNLNDFSAIESTVNNKNNHPISLQNISSYNTQFLHDKNYHSNDNNIFSSNKTTPLITNITNNRVPNTCSKSLDNDSNNHKLIKNLRNMTSTPIDDSKFRPIKSYSHSKEAKSISKYYNKRDIINKSKNQILMDNNTDIKQTLGVRSYEECINGISNSSINIEGTNTSQILSPLPSMLTKNQIGSDIIQSSSNKFQFYNNALNEVAHPFYTLSNIQEFLPYNEFSKIHHLNAEKVSDSKICSSSGLNCDNICLSTTSNSKNILGSNSNDNFGHNKFRSRSLNSKTRNKLNQIANYSTDKLHDVDKICDKNLNLPSYNENITSVYSYRDQKEMNGTTDVNSKPLNYNGTNNYRDINADTIQLNICTKNEDEIPGYKDNLNLSNMENTLRSINKLILNNCLKDFLCKNNLKANLSEFDNDYDSINLNTLINEFNNSLTNQNDSKNLNDFYNIMANKIENAVFLNMLYYLRSRSLISLNTLSQLNVDNTISQNNEIDVTKKNNVSDEVNNKGRYFHDINQHGTVLDASSNYIYDTSLVNSSSLSPLEINSSSDIDLNDHSHNINLNNLVELKLDNMPLSYSFNTSSLKNEVLDLSNKPAEDSKINNLESFDGIIQNHTGNILKKQLINNNLDLNYASVNNELENIWVMR